MLCQYSKPFYIAPCARLQAVWIYGMEKKYIREESIYWMTAGQAFACANKFLGSNGIVMVRAHPLPGEDSMSAVPL